MSRPDERVDSKAMYMGLNSSKMTQEVNGDSFSLRQQRD